MLFSGTVDMAHMLYLDCKAGRHPKTEEFKLTDPLAYQPFIISNPWSTGPEPVAPNATEGFEMNHYDPITQDSIRVDVHDKLNQFFHGLPNTYYSYVDTRGLGKFSYSYIYDSNLDSLFETMECVAQKGPVTGGKKRAREWRAYLLEQLEDKHLSKSDTEHQLGLVHCILHAERYGLEDYSDELRNNFNLGPEDHAPCVERVQQYREALRRGQDLVQVNTEWRTKFRGLFPN